MALHIDFSQPFGSDSPFGTALRGALEAEPRAAYQGALGRTPFTQSTPAIRQFYQNQFNQIYDPFQGQVFNDITQGNIPQSFTNYLTPDLLQQQYFATAPSQRPFGGISQFAPPVRYGF